VMDKFIHRENSALFRGRLDDPGFTDAQRKAILRLLTSTPGATPRLDEGRAVTGLFAAAPRECGLRMFILMRPSTLIHIRTAPRLLASRSGMPQCQHGG